MIYNEPDDRFHHHHSSTSSRKSSKQPWWETLALYSWLEVPTTGVRGLRAQVSGTVDSRLGRAACLCNYYQARKLVGSCATESIGDLESAKTETRNFDRMYVTSCVRF